MTSFLIMASLVEFSFITPSFAEPSDSDATNSASESTENTPTESQNSVDQEQTTESSDIVTPETTESVETTQPVEETTSVEGTNDVPFMDGATVDTTVGAEITPVATVVEPEIAEPEIAEPEIVQDVVEQTPSVSLLSPKQIYALLDSGLYEQAIASAELLVATYPKSGLAYLTLGDALSHYPKEDGDIYAAFDAWIKAKDIRPNGKYAKIANKRLKWALERSGIVKLIPNGAEVEGEWPEGFSYELTSSQELDLSVRTDFMLGGVYVTNIPVGKVVLEITPGTGYPTIVQSFDITPGELRKIQVPVDLNKLQDAIEKGIYTTSTNNWPSLSKKGLRLDALDLPSEYTVKFINSASEEIAYTVEEPQLLPLDNYTVHVSYLDVEYSFHWDVREKSQSSMQFFQEHLPWQYQVADNNGDVYAYGLVNPAQSVSAVWVNIPETMGRKTQDRWATGMVAAPVSGFQTTVLIDASLYPENMATQNKYDKVMLWTIVGTAAYTAWSGLQATHNINEANSETESQTRFDHNVDEADFWKQQYKGGFMVGIPLTYIYLSNKSMRTGGDKTVPLEMLLID